MLRIDHPLFHGAPGALIRSLLLLVLLCGAGCSPEKGPATIEARVLRVGLLPDQTKGKVNRRFGPLLEHLSQVTGLEVEVEQGQTYAELLDALDEARLHLAWCGGYTFVLAERRGAAEPLVMRDVDLEFTTDYVVRASAQETLLSQLRGRRLAFGPDLSTSGHLMPRLHLRKAGIDPQEFFGEVRHSTGHDQTAAWVRDGVVDVGAINSLILEAMLADGRMSRDQVRVLTRTEPYKNYVWVIPPGLDREIRAALLDAFLALDVRTPSDARVLGPLGARGFVPAVARDFDAVREAVALLDLAGWDPE